MAKPAAHSDSAEFASRMRERISADELRFVFSRSSGPGGQNVNKVSTRVTLYFDLAGTTALDANEKRMIRTRLGGRIDKNGRLRVVSSRFRTQGANRAAAIERFYEVIAAALEPTKPRKPTRVPQRTKQRRLADKRARGEVKRFRRTTNGE